jgi:hypothetical protein
MNRTIHLAYADRTAYALTMSQTESFAGLVLRFSTKSGTGNPATLHAASCNVAKVSNRKVYTITEGVEANVVDLRERGYTVKRCACCKG